jgi:hypothetical protein
MQHTLGSVKVNAQTSSEVNTHNSAKFRVGQVGPGQVDPEAGHHEIRHEKAQIYRIWAFSIRRNGHNLVTCFF